MYSSNLNFQIIYDLVPICIRVFLLCLHCKLLKLEMGLWSLWMWHMKHLDV